MHRMDERERIVGAMLGLAAGDALGVPVEFVPRKDLDANPVTGLRSGGVWNQEAGTWSDDTSLTLCLAESIVERGYDPDDFAQRALAWLDEGRWSARGIAFDVGGATRRALDRIRAGLPALLAGGRGENDNGNGSLMRILPASVWLAWSPEPLRFRMVCAFSAPTHGHPRSMLGCWLFSLVAARLLAGEPPRSSYRSAMAEAARAMPTLPPPIRAESALYSRVLGGELDTLPRAAIRGSGYVLHSLEAALWCLLTTDSYSACVLGAVNLGEDTDTTAAVAGALAGMTYGDAAIPRPWREALPRLEEIERLAARLAACSAVKAPLPGSYWVLPGHLLAGPHPVVEDPESSRDRIEALVTAGISSLVDLTEESEALPGAGRLLGARAGDDPFGSFTRRRFPLRDRSVNSEMTTRAVEGIDALLSAGERVYVHCHGGIGRTGMVIGAWLAFHGFGQREDVLELLAALRRAAGERTPSPETEDQARAVRAVRPGPGALTL